METEKFIVCTKNNKQQTVQNCQSSQPMNMVAMATVEPSDSEKALKTIKVLVKYRISSDSTFEVKIKQSEYLRKIKKHVTESLDIQGR